MGFKAAFGGFMAAAREDRLLNEEREEEEKIREENRLFQTELADKQHERALERMALQHQNALKLQGARLYADKNRIERLHNQSVKGVAIRIGVDPSNKEEMAKISNALRSYSSPNEFIEDYREGYIRDKMSDPGLSPDQQMADAMPPRMAGDQDPNRGITVEQDNLGLQFGQDPYATLPKDVGRMSSRQIKQWIDVNKANAKPNDVAYMQEQYDTQLKIERNEPITALEETLSGIDKEMKIPAFKDTVRSQFEKGKIDGPTRDNLLKRADERLRQLTNISNKGEVLEFYGLDEGNTPLPGVRVHAKSDKDGNTVYVKEGTSEIVDVSNGRLIDPKVSKDWAKLAVKNANEVSSLAGNFTNALVNASDLIDMSYQNPELFNQYSVGIGNIANHIDKLISAASNIGYIYRDGSDWIVDRRKAAVWSDHLKETAGDKAAFDARFLDLVFADATRNGEDGLGRISNSDIDNTKTRLGGSAINAENFREILRTAMVTRKQTFDAKLLNLSDTHGTHFGGGSDMINYQYGTSLDYLNRYYPEQAEYVWANIENKNDTLQTTVTEGTSTDVSWMESQNGSTWIEENVNLRLDRNIPIETIRKDIVDHLVKNKGLDRDAAIATFNKMYGLK